jgi:hypothetical protein
MGGVLFAFELQRAHEPRSASLCAVFPDELSLFMRAAPPHSSSAVRSGGRLDASRSRRRSSAVTFVWSARPMRPARD